jgi:hypothetical protein
VEEDAGKVLERCNYLVIIYKEGYLIVCIGYGSDVGEQSIQQQFGIKRINLTSLQARGKKTKEMSSDTTIPQMTRSSMHRSAQRISQYPDSLRAGFACAAGRSIELAEGGRR